MRLKNRKKSAAAIKSMKVGTDELKDLIKGAVKEAMGEEDDTGDVEKSQIVGKVFLRVWPLSSFSLIH